MWVEFAFGGAALNCQCRSDHCQWQVLTHASPSTQIPVLREKFPHQCRKCKSMHILRTKFRISAAYLNAQSTMSTAALQRSASALRSRRDGDLAAIAMQPEAQTSSARRSAAKAEAAASTGLGKAQSQMDTDSTSIVRLTASSLRSAIASGVVSAEDAFKAIAQRCATVGLALGAVSESVLDDALATAGSCERQRTPEDGRER